MNDGRPEGPDIGIALIGHVGMGPAVRGIALAAADDFSTRYDLDRERGIFSRPSHKLYGESYVGRILVLNAAKGGVASAWMLREMALMGKAPLALLLNDANPVMAQGAAFADLPFMDRFECDITAAVRTGDTLHVDPAKGVVTIEGRGQ
jgi:predicted aconitase with swiveling domain